MHRNTNTIKERDVVLWVNISLAGVVVLLLFYYIMMANAIAAKNYKIQTLRDKVESLSEINSALMSQKVLLENPIALREFAQSANLVEAQNISYIFDNKDVALQR